MYQLGLLHRYSSELNVISVGNLSVGGTGKTPMVEFLLDHHPQLGKVAVVSRGYGRDTKGLLVLDSPLDANRYGDEPCQIKHKFPQVPFLVSENRVEALEYIETHYPHVTTVLLDDAYQHLPVARDSDILLTTYQNPFFRDFVLPTGALREFRFQAKRAKVVVVTKCPNVIQDGEEYVNAVLRYAPFAKVYFSRNFYDSPRQIKGNGTTLNKVVLLTSIANPVLLEEHLLSLGSHVFPYQLHDHASYSLALLAKVVTYCKSKGLATIITTAKDEVKLTPFLDESLWEGISIFVIDVKVNFGSIEEQVEFQKLVWG